MKITYDWLKDHLKISAKEDKLLEKLTDIGLEVESIENLSKGLDLFKVAKILKTDDVCFMASRCILVTDNCSTAYCLAVMACNLWEALFM